MFEYNEAYRMNQDAREQTLFTLLWNRENEPDSPTKLVG